MHGFQPVAFARSEIATSYSLAWSNVRLTVLSTTVPIAMDWAGSGAAVGDLLIAARMTSHDWPAAPTITGGATGYSIQSRKAGSGWGVVLAWKVATSADLVNQNLTLSSGNTGRVFDSFFVVRNASGSANGNIVGLLAANPPSFDANYTAPGVNNTALGFAIAGAMTDSVAGTSNGVNNGFTPWSNAGQSFTGTIPPLQMWGNHATRGNVPSGATGSVRFDYSAGSSYVAYMAVFN
jgi:hypothetical protein